VNVEGIAAAEGGERCVGGSNSFLYEIEMETSKGERKKEEEE